MMREEVVVEEEAEVEEELAFDPFDLLWIQIL